ncbi:MAG TPA: hypothetical protein VG389_13440, partial [Myxococcota bacterium]|nr:hypothetical protein [Myxococcota bacterium]
LVDFWDYTCVYCIRTLPHLSEWARRYREAGLVVIGAHAPEFPFAAERANVEVAVRSLGVRYPVALDGARRIWRAFHNRYLPARYLAGRDGRVRWQHFGEGRYAETEHALRALLAAPERPGGPPRPLPDPSAAVTFVEAAGGEGHAGDGLGAGDDDPSGPGTLCQPVTPELYLNLARGRWGNGPADVPDTDVALFVDAGEYVPDRATLGGRWRLSEGHAEHAGGEATLAVRYTAAEVNLVLTPPPGGRCTIYVEDEAGPLPAARRGADVGGAALAGTGPKDASGAGPAAVDVTGAAPAGAAAKEEARAGRAVIEVVAPRMYALVRDERVGEGLLRLRLPASCEGLRAYAFTFLTPSRRGAAVATAPAPTARW